MHPAVSLLVIDHNPGSLERRPLMWELFSRIRRVAPHYLSLLITGETGTGKDLIAPRAPQTQPCGATSCSTAQPLWKRCSRASCSAP
jgi:hypothetical protein